MDCRLFKDKMGAWLEGELPAADLSAFKAHLEACPQCRKDLEELEKTKASLRALEQVEPPAWFEQKVMAGVREAHERKSVWRRLFYPLHVKVPVQALATIIVVVFAVQVFRDMEPRMDSRSPAQAPPAPVGEPVPKRETAPSPMAPEKKPATPAVKAPAAPMEKPAIVSDAPRQQAAQAEREAISQSVGREYKAAARPDLPADVPPLAPAEEGVRSGAVMPPPAVMSSPAPSPARMKERSMAVGKRLEKQESEAPSSLDYAPAAKGKAALADYARRPASQVSLKVKPRDAGSAPEKIKLLLGESGAVNISATSGRISAELPADRWGGFAAGLTQIGEIKGFPSLPPAGGSISVAISIETDPTPSDAK